jgi:murein DD-endopeptidase MepM/ murein hydrolase activator NlpD
VTRLLVLSLAAAAALFVARPAFAYGWPVKPFHKMHAIRGAFDDPRFHLGSEGALSAFHFGIDIAVKDGTRVYAVAPGYVTAHAADLTVTTKAGRGFGYWHIRPVVKTHQRVKLHQLLGYVRPGWGHVHFAESTKREYRNPLRKGALTPFRDRVPPTVASVSLASTSGLSLDARRVSGAVDVVAEIYDLPPVLPAGAWSVARLTPAVVWWRLMRDDVAVTDWTVSADFHFALMPASLYGALYAPGTYQNKANRPGKYLFWVVHDLETSTLPNGRYSLDVLAADTRWNLGLGSVAFTVSNAESGPAVPAPGMVSRSRHAE